MPDPDLESGHGPDPRANNGSNLVRCLGRSRFSGQRPNRGLEVKNIKNQIGNPIWKPVKIQVCDKIWDMVWEQIGSKVRGQIWEQIWIDIRDQIVDQKRKM
jgi:hypothetical protein